MENKKVTKFGYAQINDKSRHYCFTLYDYSVAVESEIEIFYKSHISEIVFILCGYEICPKTKRNHIQGYIQFKSPRYEKPSREFIHLMTNSKCHVSPCKGSSIDNDKYCKKEMKYFKFGNIEFIDSISKKVIKVSTQNVKDMLDNGANMANIIDKVNTLSHIKYAESYLKIKEQPRKFTKDFQVYWFYGKTGTGKTYSIENLLEDKNYYSCMETSKWWEGYDGEKIVLIDDFRSSFCAFSTLLKILQPHKFRVETKGGSRQLLATTFYITSCYSPTDAYSTNENIDQLLRRLTEVRYYSAEGVYDVIKLQGDVENRCEDLKSFCLDRQVLKYKIEDNDKIII